RQARTGEASGLRRGGVTVVTRSEFATQGDAIADVVQDADANRCARAPATLARDRGMTPHAQAAHDEGTPLRRRIHEIPAARNVNTDGLPLFAGANGRILVIRVVAGGFEIQRHVRVHPETNTEAAHGICLDLAIVVAEYHADARHNVPVAVVRVGQATRCFRRCTRVLCVRDRHHAYSTQGQRDDREQAVTFHRRVSSLLILQASTILDETVFPFSQTARPLRGLQAILPSPFRYGCASLAKNKQLRLCPADPFIWNSGAPAQGE